MTSVVAVEDPDLSEDEDSGAVVRRGGVGMMIMTTGAAMMVDLEVAMK